MITLIGLRIRSSVHRGGLGFCLLQFAFSLSVAAQPTAFTYQGRLTDNGRPAQGLYDLRFTIYDAETNGTPLSIVTAPAVEVSEELFTVLLDFGASHFDGSERWLGVALAAIQGLNEKLERENAELRERLVKLEQMLSQNLKGDMR